MPTMPLMTPRGPRVALTLLLGLSAFLEAGSAVATLRAVERAYEVGIGQVQLPPGEAGPVVVRPCRGCGQVTLRSSASTTWHLGTRNPPIPRAEFIRQLRGAAVDRSALVYVFYRPGTRDVTRIVLDAATLPAVATGRRP